MGTYGQTDEQALRERAITQLKKRRDFYAHLIVYAVINGFIIVIWAMTGHGGFFWPIFVIIPWGLGVVMNAWDVFYRADQREDKIQREMDRLRKETQ
jgi:hypothetical protein